MNCDGYDILLSARLDGELTHQEEADLEAHLAQCPRCRRQARALEELRRQTLALTDEVPGRLKGWLADQDWAALPQDEPAPAADPDDADEAAPAPDLPVVLTHAPAATPPRNPSRRKLPWLLCGAAAAILLAVGLCQILLPNSMGSGFSQAMMEVFRQEESTSADSGAQEDSALPDGQAESEAEAGQDPQTSQDSQDQPTSSDPDNPTPPGDNGHTPPSGPGQSGEGNDPSGNGGQDTPSTNPGEDDPGQNDPGQDPPSQDDPGQTEEPNEEPDDPPTNGLTQQQAQDLLAAHLSAQGRPLSLLPLGASGGMWRFSGTDSTGRVVSFFMVSQRSGEIQEVPVPPPEEGPTLGPGGLS